MLICGSPRAPESGDDNLGTAEGKRHPFTFLLKETNGMLSKRKDEEANQ